MFSFIRKLRTGNRYGVPPEVVQKLAVNPHPFTPDITRLHERKHNLVFLYGNEMSNGREALPQGKLPYTDVFTEIPLVMIKTKENQKIIPAVVNPPEEINSSNIFRRLPKAKVKGELYQLDDVEIAALDAAYQNGLLFNRIRVTVKVENFAITSHERTSLTSVEHVTSGPLYYEKRAFMYLGNFDYFNYAKIDRDSYKLLKDRPDNQDYEPRYFYTPQDWGEDR